MSSGSVGAEPSDHSRCSRIARVRTGQGTTMTGMPAFSASTNRRGGLRPGGGGSPGCIRSEKQFPQHVGVRTCESFSQQLRPVDIVGGDHRVYSFVRVTLVGPSKNHAMTISFRLRHAARTDQARLIHHSAGRNPCAACRRQRGRGRSAADRDRGRSRKWPNPDEAALEGVYHLRTSADAARLQAALAADRGSCAAHTSIWTLSATSEEPPREYGMMWSKCRLSVIPHSTHLPWSRFHTASFTSVGARNDIGRQRPQTGNARAV